LTRKRAVCHVPQIPLLHRGAWLLILQLYTQKTDKVAAHDTYKIQPRYDIPTISLLVPSDPKSFPHASAENRFDSLHHQKQVWSCRTLSRYNNYGFV